MANPRFAFKVFSSLRRMASSFGGGTFASAEKRSDTVELGDLKTGRLHLILGGDTASGHPVNEQTALGVAAVSACVNLKAEMVAKLPIHLFKDDGKSRVPIEIEDHPALNVIKFPSEMHTDFELRRLMQVGEGLGGNGYARVFRDEFMRPRAMQWIKPCDVRPFERKTSSGESFIAYDVKGIPEPLTRFDIVHIMGDSEDGICGRSKIKLLRESIGTAAAQTKAAGRLMKNGAKFPGFMTVEGVTKKEQLEDIRDEINANMGGVINAGKIPVVGGSMTWQQTNGMSMVDAEFIESRRFELQEIARLYRVPSFMIGDSTSSTTWGTGIEQQTLGFLNYCLDPHLVAWEKALAMTLLTTDEIRSGFFFRFDRDELINASLEARGNFYQSMRNIGVYSPNDVRAKLNEPMIPVEQGGDDYGKPLNSNAKESSTPANPETVLTDGE